MIVRVEDLIRLNSLSNCRLVAGQGGLSKEVRWFWVCFFNEISPWALGKELVFISGAGIDRQPKNLVNLMEQFRVSNVSAVFVLLEYHFEAAPPEMIELADKYDIPLFEMPNVVPLVEVTKNLAELLLKNRTLEQQSGDILRNCIFGHEIDLPRHEQDLINLGYGLKRENYLLKIKLRSYISEGDYGAAADFFQSIFNNCALFGASFIHKERYIVLAMGSNGACTQEIISARCEKLINYANEKEKYRIDNIGISENYRDIRKIKLCYRHAGQALDSMRVQAPPTSIMHYLQMPSIVRLMLEIEDPTTIRQSYENTICKLIEYDTAHNSEFFHTLEVFLCEDANVVQSAKTLCIHRNTMLYRIGRINTLLNCRIEDVYTRFALMTDLFLYRYSIIHPLSKKDV